MAARGTISRHAAGSALRRLVPPWPSFDPTMPIATVDPATGRTLRTYDAYDDAAVDAALARASETARAWRATPVAERAALVGRVGALLDERRERYARIMTTEMGKPLQAARDEA